MNVFQQVFAGVDYQTNDKKPHRTGRMSLQTAQPPQDPVISVIELPMKLRSPTKRKIPRRKHTLTKTSPKSSTSSENSAPENAQPNRTDLEKQLNALNNSIKQRTTALSRAKDENFILTRKCCELEHLATQNSVAASETSKKIAEMQAQFEVQEAERNELWEFRLNELQIELEILQEGSPSL